MDPCFYDLGSLIHVIRSYSPSLRGWEYVDQKLFDKPSGEIRQGQNPPKAHTKILRWDIDLPFYDLGSFTYVIRSYSPNLRAWEDVDQKLFDKPWVKSDKAKIHQRHRPRFWDEISTFRFMI